MLSMPSKVCFPLKGPMLKFCIQSVMICNFHFSKQGDLILLIFFPNGTSQESPVVQLQLKLVSEEILKKTTMVSEGKIREMAELRENGQKS